jgi:PAS domain S-box-containing protein
MDRMTNQEQLEMLRLIFDSIHNGAMVTDAAGRITHFNRPYEKFLGLRRADCIGKHCTQVVENTRMHIVARTGRPEINVSQSIKGQNMVVQRIPIRKDGRIVAVFGQVMFKDVREVGKLAQKLSLLESKVKLYEQELINLRSTRYTIDSILGISKPIATLKKQARKAADNNFPVLITGSSGTGKELFAQAIHHASHRNMHPFVRINCAAIPRDLLESELFGYEKGAFTGARAGGKPGKFELAHLGSIFLDEIGDLPLEMQPKLLRVLEEKEFERIGGTHPVRSDFRLITATNQDLEQMMAEGRFREDLFYRLNVIRLSIPPLRERPEDILPIAENLLKRMTQETDLERVHLSRSAQTLLKAHDWPGNVRELANALERALSAVDGDTIDAEDLPFHIKDPGSRQRHVKKPIQSLKATLEKEECTTILRALEETHYNKARAAALLGIHRTLLYKKMHKHGLNLSPEAQ